MRSATTSLQSRHTFIPADRHSRKELPGSIQAIGKTPVPCIEQGSFLLWILCLNPLSLIDNSVSKNEELS